jgi:hypothetical protein
MSDRRMFSKQIIDSDAFLDMPLSTQALYFHLAMRADDDGFVNNPKKIMRMTGSNDDELKVLLTKRFILVFESGVIVIKHWRIHNCIQKDRYKPTVYQNEFSKLKLKENNGYTLETECKQIVSEMETQVSIGKERIEKVRIEKTLPTSDEVRSLFIGYLSSLNITDIDEEKLNAQLRLFIRYYIGDADQAGKWQLQRTKFNPKTCVKNWIDKNVNTYKSFKKVEPVQDDITCRCWDDLCGALKKYNPKCLPGKVFKYVKNEDQNGRYANWTWEQIWRAAKKLADYPEYQEKQERKITIENPEWKKNREKVNELLGGF